MAKTCKYYKYRKYVSYDSGTTWTALNEYDRGALYEENSPDCGGGVTYYRWQNLDPSTDYYCEGTTKMYKQQKQVSTDNINWTNVVPAEYQEGMPYEYYSTDCGYVPQSGDPNQYLTFVALEDGTFSFNRVGMYYTLDSGTTWAALSASGNTPTVRTGDKIMWKSTNTPHTGGTYSTDRGIGRFSSTGEFEVEGNAMSLLYGDNFLGKTDLTGKNCALSHLFYSCNKIKSAEKMVLPATTLSDRCYEYMFDGCTGLTIPPVLPAQSLAYQCYLSMFSYCRRLITTPQLPVTTLAVDCYAMMFDNCSSLTTAPELPATTLTRGCYSQMFFNCSNLRTPPVLHAATLDFRCCLEMFRGCTSLTTAPVLSATTLAQMCYYNMFSGCTSLNSITCLATDKSATDCTYNWLGGVASTGTFTKAASMTNWPTGVNGIPSGWTVQDAP